MPRASDEISYQGPTTDRVENAYIDDDQGSQNSEGNRSQWKNYKTEANRDNSMSVLDLRSNHNSMVKMHTSKNIPRLASKVSTL